MAVVDPECRVIGVDALRVVDSSIFPTHPQWEPERAVDHGRRKRRRSHPGQATPAQRQQSSLDQPEMGNLRQIDIGMFERPG